MPCKGEDLTLFVLVQVNMLEPQRRHAYAVHTNSIGKRRDLDEELAILERERVRQNARRDYSRLAFQNVANFS